MSNRQFLLIISNIGLLTLAAFLFDTYQSCTSDGGQLGWMRRMGLECKRGPKAGGSRNLQWITGVPSFSVEAA